MFPKNKRFAFTIFDDTDYCTLDAVGPVYKFLGDLGFRTTKSVWPLASVPEGAIGGASLAEKDYLGFIRDLQTQGFEIGLHGVRNHHSPRDVVEKGLKVFKDLLGHDPRSNCNHLNNRENIYWGSDRFATAVPKLAATLLTRVRGTGRFQGNVEGSPYFWGDLCRNHIDYFRSFAVEEINLLRINPTLPYYNPKQPYVRYWFTSTYGDKAPSFCRALREEEQDRLEAERGVCIMYTHFGLGFCKNGELDPTFDRLMRRLAKKSGWFVPVSVLLDHLRSKQAKTEIGSKELGKLERNWFIQRLRRGTN
jgi:hypothetical protein